MTKQSPGRLAGKRQPILGKGPTSMRQCVLLAAMALILASCSDSDGIQSKPSAGQIDYLSGFLGGVAADEPRAALVARDTLSAGGTAADAVTAAALAYAVTYPGGAGLGGGGICVVGDPITGRGRAETIDFPARAAAGGGPLAIPGMVRGLGLLQGRYGKLRWEATVAPAEQLARFGDGASRAFLRSVTETDPALAADPALAEILGGPGGRLPAEGAIRSQQKLAGVLARIRSAGPADFYQGHLSQVVLADMAREGGRITAEDLRNYAITIEKPIALEFEKSVTLYASNNARGGAIAAWLAEQGFDDGGLISGSRFRADRFAENMGQAYRNAGAEAPKRGYGSASIAVIDRNGLAVACSFSMGPAFGSRRVGRETGLLFAAPPGVPGDESPYMAAMVGINGNVHQAFIAAGASGGAPAPAALAQAVLQTTLAKSQKDPAPQAIALPRLFHAGPQAPVLAEPGLPADSLAALRGRGLAVTEAGPLGRVTLAYCGEGVPRAPQSCSFAADPRGFGLAVGRLF
ncbi:gamma-glutamyltransferase [Ferrovibrio sp.]|uniref:gamma-glutamyltransferase n=1 Tax=Ferrovibrio sp. TaxID=1917215 RepID=UPI003518EA92